MGPFGSDIKAENFVENGVPVIKGGNLNQGRFCSGPFDFLLEEKANDLANASAFPLNLVFTHRGTLGQVGLVPKGAFHRYIVSQSQMVLSCKNGTVDPMYLYYYFKSAVGQHELLKNTSQTGVPAISRPITSLKNIRLLLPGLSEQNVIAHILGTLDDKIELNRKMNSTLEEMARALYKSWFVDFDPVRAKMDGRWKRGKSLPGLPAHLWDLFPDQLVNSELECVPKGWDSTTINTIAEVIDCLHAKKPGRQSEGKPFLQLNNIKDNGLLDMEDTYFIGNIDYIKWISRMEASFGDCVITNVGRVGAVAQIGPKQNAALGRNMTGLRSKVHYKFPTFLLETLRSDKMKEEIIKMTDTGTILNALNVRNIPKLKIILPTTGILSVFETLARPFRARMEKNLSEINNLANIRNTLLPKLISGELKPGKIKQ